VTSPRFAQTIVNVQITYQSWHDARIEGELYAASYRWWFKWYFGQGKLTVFPSLGRALIFEPLNRFLERSDYQLEPGGTYQFTVRGRF
jgi:hypothetical protein